MTSVGLSQPAPRPARARRTVLAVPGSSERFIAKARGLAADCIFLDLEDAVAPAEKHAARAQVIAALTSGGTWAPRTITVRVNDWTTPWTTQDAWQVVTGAGAHIDALVLPKATSAAQVHALDLVVTQAEQAAGLPVGRIGFEVQVEDAAGLLHVGEIASSSPRIETLVFGPGDWMASMGMSGLSVGSIPEGYPGDHFHHPMATILVAARANGLAAIDGPFVGIGDPDGFRASARRAAALGYDGKWVIHPSQVEIGNEVFSPAPEVLDRARRIVAAYTEGGAIVVDGEMVDEAGVKVARAMLARVGE
ncbi:HpcH/HpaI aldolase/citrate lyase family protein [Propionibacteriaceae bacterium G1746]